MKVLCKKNQEPQHTYEERGILWWKRKVGRWSRTNAWGGADLFFEVWQSRPGSPLLTKGKYYEIHQRTIGAAYVHILDDKGNNWIFSNNLKSKYYIWKYFYTPQQTRKLKLQKLNETNIYLFKFYFSFLGCIFCLQI